MKKRFCRSLIIGIILAGSTLLFPSAIKGEQPKTNLDVDTYARFLTGWFEENDLEIIPNGEISLPDPLVVLSENYPKDCVPNAANQCEGTAEVYYPEKGVTRTEKVDGQCRPHRVGSPDSSEKSETSGTCVYNKRPSLRKNYLGADTSGKTELPIPKSQSYSMSKSNPGCQYDNNLLACGEHDLILPKKLQAQLRLGVLYRAIRTYQVYNNKQNVNHELPIGGVNWKEEVACKDPKTGTIGNKSLLELWGNLPADMAPGVEEGGGINENFQKIWGTFEDSSGRQDPTWINEWYDKFEKAKVAGEPWADIFGCTPLYPHDTNEPTLAIGSIVIGSTSNDNPYLVPFNSATLTSDIGAKANFESSLIKLGILYPREQFIKFAGEARNISRPIGNPFFNPRITFHDTPCMMVYNSAEICARGGTDEDKTITPFKSVDAITLGRILDRNNIYYNRTNPPPRSFEALKGVDKNPQEADAVHPDSSTPTLLEVIAGIVQKFVPVITRDYMICGPYCQASRVLENHLYQTLTTTSELSSENKFDKNPLNIIPTDTGDFSATSERTLNIKLAYSRLMACQAPERYDYESTPKEVAEGTAQNTCGTIVSSSDNNAFCDKSKSDKEAANIASKETGIPAKWLLAIKKVESGDSQNDSCSKNSANAVGPMQIVDSTYNYVTCENERVNLNDLKCERPEGKLSRCNLADAMILAGRVVQWKLGKSDFCSPSPTKGLSTASLYYAINNYYGKCQPDGTTSGWNIPGAVRPPNYGDLICYFAGEYSKCSTMPQCPTGNDEI